ncbi:MAG: orotidine-5'-phosphate decarboxylase [Acidimicrobiia bacterium]|nr:orotidine-5'-phosphate decarboxylase [Acidimicrobiia bacterium]
MTAQPAAPEAVRSRLALVLDLDDAVAALSLARDLQPWFGTAKVGLELYSASGPNVMGALQEMGYDVFCDLKFHDIPTTVERAARVVGSLGAHYLNFHAQGGTTMLKAGVEGFISGAVNAGLPIPTALAVTVLTSDGDAPAHILPKRVQAALESGCGGIVCAASDVAEAKQYGPRLLTVVPGIRPAGAPRHDQARAATPEEAITAGADLLVIGRAVTHADDPAAAATVIAAAVGACVL